MKDSTVNRKAIELLNNGKITARVKQLQSELQKSSDIKKQDILKELACIAFSDIRDYVEFDGTTVKFKPFKKLTDKQAKAIESIKETKQGIELRLHGKSWSIERICKLLGFDTPQDVKLQLESLDDAALDLILNRIMQNQNG